MTESALLPWQVTQWAQVSEERRSGRLPHAVLLVGPTGVGKELFARFLAQSLLCLMPGPDLAPCAECRGCRLVLAGSHPDLRILQPERDAKTGKESKVIKVDQVRALSEWMGMKSQYGGMKIGLISPADQMNISAANSLLKTLEEPPGQALLMLASARSGALPATVRSRCQRLVFPAAHAGAAQQWLGQQLTLGSARWTPELLLDLAEGAPLAALRLAEGPALEHRLQMLGELESVVRGQADPVHVAESWWKRSFPDGLYWMWSWVADMIRLRMSAAPPSLINPDLRGRLAGLARSIAVPYLFERLDQVAEAIRVTQGGANLNLQLLLEDLLIPWGAASQ